MTDEDSLRKRLISAYPDLIPPAIRRLPRYHDLQAWAAARNLDVAENASLIPDGRSAGELSRTLRDLLWLTTESKHDNEYGPSPSPVGSGLREEVPVIHPWLRRLLLLELAHETGLSRKRLRWDAIQEKLKSYFLSQAEPDMSAAMYHTLAQEDGSQTQLREVVDYLDKIFTEYDLVDHGHGSLIQRWIEEYKRITCAPNRFRLDQPMQEMYDSLMTGAAPTIASGHRNRKSVIHALVVARWFWSDWLLDPWSRRGQEIAFELDLLADHTKTGRSCLRREAERYA